MEGRAVAAGACPHDPFVCSVQAHCTASHCSGPAIRRRFLSACKVLGQERLRAARPSTTAGTRSSATRWPAAGLWPRSARGGPLECVRDQRYLHIVVDDTEPVGHLFRFPPAGDRRSTPTHC